MGMRLWGVGWSLRSGGCSCFVLGVRRVHWGDERCFYVSFFVYAFITEVGGLVGACA